MAGHLRSNGLCGKCKLSRGALGNGCLRRRSYTRTNPCRFQSEENVLLHCAPCNDRHDHHAFPLADHPLHGPGCLGRWDAVQLCEHAHVSWGDVEGHMRRWRERTCEGRDWQRACLGDFNVECRHPSHDVRCTDEEPHTWPRARLVIGGLYEDMIFLTLEWKPHSGLGKFTRTPDGQSLPSELRSLFRQYRKTAGGILLRSYASDSLPEMACYAPDDCSCLLYDPGSSSKTWFPAGRTRFASFFRDDIPFGCFGHHRHQRHRSLTYIQQVQMTKQWPRGREDSICVVTNCETRVRVFDKAGVRGKLNPSHEWLHAMDPDTYPRPEQGLGMPLCEDGD